MPLSVEPLHPPFAARLSGVDVRQPVADGTIAQVKRALAQHVVCIISHDTPPSDDAHIAFSGQLGPMDRGKEKKFAGVGERLPHPEIIDQSNLDETGRIYADGDRRLANKRANRLWHTDMSFFEIRATFSLLVGHDIPPAGGDTQFIDMRAVWDALPPDRRTGLEDLVAEHSYFHSRVLGGGPEPTPEERASHQPARHPLVHVHGPSGRKSLYLASHVFGIVGWPQERARALIAELTAFATQPQFVYTHRWRTGDVVIWDNLATMHRATEFDDLHAPRDVRRTTCRERSVVSDTVMIV